MNPTKLRSAAVVFTTALGFALAPPAGAEYEEYAMNGTFSVVSNGEWARMNDRYQDEPTVRSTWTVNTEARVGQPYGAIFATPFKRDSATGELLLSNGLPQNDPGHRRVLGNINPKWVGGWNNEIRFHGITASALLDFHRGGNIYSVTNMFGQYTGVLSSTIKGRQVDWNNPGLVVHGIDQKTGKENTVNVNAEDYYQSLFENGEAFLYDDSYVKLREVRVGFDLPSGFTRSLRASNVNVAFIGRNLWTHTKVPNIDPEFTYGTGNYQGAEFAALPTTRSLGFNVRITP